MRLLLVGGGHAHMGLLKRLSQFTSRGVEVTLLAPESSHLYSGMGPGRVGGRYSRRELSFPIRRLLESGGGRFHYGWAERIDPQGRRVIDGNGESLEYDVVSFNLGSVVPFEKLVPPEARGAIGRTVFPAKPVVCLDAAWQRLGSLDPPRRIAVVGGGPGGAELAANVAWATGSRRQVHLFAATRVLPRQPERFRTLALRRLQALGVRVHEGCRVSEVTAEEVHCTEGSFPSQMTLLATGVVPPSIFRNSGLPVGPRGGLLVTRELHTPSFPEVFGGGDCIDIEHMPLDRVGVYALRETRYLEQNIAAALGTGEAKPFTTSGNYLLICNLAGGYGVGTKWGIVAAGRPVGFIKHAIDRWFVESHRRSSSAVRRSVVRALDGGSA